MKQSCRKRLLQGVLSLVTLVSVSQLAIPRLAQADSSRVGQEAAPAPQTDAKDVGPIVMEDYFLGPKDVLDITVWKKCRSPRASHSSS